MKRIFSILASVMLLLTICVPEIQAADYFNHVKIGDLYYRLKGGMAIVIPEDGSVVAASNYKGLKEANIPSSVTYYETGNTYVVKAIHTSTFRDAEDLEKVTLPNTMTDIGESAFENTGLQSITIPASVTSIGERAFYDTPLYDKSSNWYDGVLYIGNYLIAVKGDVKQLIVKEGTRLLAEDASHLPGVAYPDIEYVYLPNTVEYIGAQAFSWCKNLETVIMSNKLKSIGYQAFSNCEKLKSIINLPSTCEFIGSHAFADCSSLTEITLPENPEYQTVAKGMFEECTNLTKIVLPKQITRIEEWVFRSCTSLKYIYCYGRPKEMNRSAFEGIDIGKITVYFPERHKAFYEEHWKGFNLVPLRFSEDGIYYELNDTKKTAVVVPERDDADNYKSLSGSILIDKIVIADGETFTINGMAQGAFKFSKIGRITIDAAMNEIPADAFVYNINLTDAVLPKSVTSIGDRAFSGCSSLELVPGLTNDQKDYLPNVDKIGNSAFSGCVKLPKLRLLTETEIGEWAFSGCKGVKDIILGADVKTIGANAFSECSGLESMTIYSATPLPFTANMITGVDKSKFVVYVQAKDVAKYKAADGWKEFTIKPIEGEKQYTVIVDVNDPEGGTVTGAGTYYEGETYTLTAIPNEGWHFVRWGNGSTMNPATGTISNDFRTTAFFGPDAKFYDIQVLSSDEKMGTVSGGGTHIEEGQSVTLTATPKSGYEFMYWTNLQGYRFKTNPFSYTVGASDTYTAHFRQIPDYTSYNIHLNGTQITSNNQNDVLGDGVWAYDETTNTLTTMKAMTYTITNTDFIDNYIADPVTIVLNHFITINASTTNTSNDIVLYSAYGFHITGTPEQRLTINGTDMRLIYAAYGPVVIDNVVMLDAKQTITSWGETNLTTKCAVQLKGSDDALTVNGADVYIKTSGSSLFKATNRTNANLSLIRADIISGAMDGTSLNISNDVNRYILHYSNADLEDICPVYGGFGFHYPGEIIIIEACPKEGYLFVQWSDGVTDNPRVITMPEHNLYLDPIVEEDGTLTPDGAFVNAYAPAGEGTIMDFEGGWFNDGIELTITAEPAEGYRFVQWSDGETDNPRVLIVEAGKDISIDAQFEQIPRYTVTFLDWDDEVLKIEKVYEGESATAPEDVYREGYTFTGWDSWDWTDVQCDLILKAQFEINTYTVRFFDIDEELLEKQIVNWNEAATAPEAPEVEGYTFTGWSEYFDHVTCDIDVYALYELNNSEQGIDEVQRDNVQGTKVLKDGQLFIERNGKTYNALGAEVQ